MISAGGVTWKRRKGPALPHATVKTRSSGACSAASSEEPAIPGADGNQRRLVPATSRWFSEFDSQTPSGSDAKSSQYLLGRVSDRNGGINCTLARDLPGSLRAAMGDSLSVNVTRTF